MLLYHLSLLANRCSNQSCRGRQRTYDGIQAVLASLPTQQVLVRFRQTFLDLLLQPQVLEDLQRPLHLVLVDRSFLQPLQEMHALCLVLVHVLARSIHPVVQVLR